MYDCQSDHTSIPTSHEPCLGNLIAVQYICPVYKMVMIRKTTIHSYSRLDMVSLGLITSISIVTGQIGLFFATEYGHGTLVWPPAGIALAALILYGYRFWPGIFPGTVLLNLTIGAPLVVICNLAVGNVLGALLGTYLLKRLVDFRAALERLQDALGLIIYAAGINTLIIPTSGIISRLLTSGLPWEVSGLAWLIWWMSDAVGVLLIAPVILSWAAHPRVDTTPRRLIKVSLLLLLTMLVSITVYSDLFYRQTYLLLTYTIFLLVIWTALRFRQRGAGGNIGAIRSKPVSMRVGGSNTITILPRANVRKMRCRRISALFTGLPMPPPQFCTSLIWYNSATSTSTMNLAPSWAILSKRSGSWE